MSHNNWKFSWTSDWDEIFSATYIDAWKKLFSSAGRTGPVSPFFHPGIVRAWIDSVDGMRRFTPYFFQATSRQGAQVLLPCILDGASWVNGFVRRLRPVGWGPFDYHDPLVLNSHDSKAPLEGFWDAFLDEISPICDEVDLPRVRNQFQNHESDWSFSGSAPAVDISSFNSFDHFFYCQKKNLRKDLQRRLRRANETGTLRFRTDVASNKVQISDWIESLVANKFGDEANSEWWMSFLQGLANQTASNGGPAHFSALYLNEQSISWHVGFAIEGTYFSYLPAYDASCAYLSPGKLHLYFLFEEAIREHCHTVDLLRGVSDHKVEWQPVSFFRTSRMHRISDGARSRLACIARKGLKRGANLLRR